MAKPSRVLQCYLRAASPSGLCIQVLCQPYLLRALGVMAAAVRRTQESAFPVVHVYASVTGNCSLSQTEGIFLLGSWFMKRKEEDEEEERAKEE